MAIVQQICRDRSVAFRLRKNTHCVLHAIAQFIPRSTTSLWPAQPKIGLLVPEGEPRKLHQHSLKGFLFLLLSVVSCRTLSWLLDLVVCYQSWLLTRSLLTHKSNASTGNCVLVWNSYMLKLSLEGCIILCRLQVVLCWCWRMGIVYSDSVTPYLLI